MVSNIFYFHPDPWGRDPIWQISFRFNHQLVQTIYSNFLCPGNPVLTSNPLMFMESTIYTIRFPMICTSFCCSSCQRQAPGNRHPREVCFKDQLSGTWVDRDGAFLGVFFFLGGGARHGNRIFKSGSIISTWKTMGTSGPKQKWTGRYCHCPLVMSRVSPIF